MGNWRRRLVWLSTYIIIAEIVSHSIIYISKPARPHFLPGWLHFESVVLSVAITLYIYQYARDEGFYDCIASEKLRRILGGPLFWAVSSLMSFFSVITINSYPLHLVVLTAFFTTFVVWDIILWRSLKIDANAPKTKFCTEKARYWFVYVDLPTPGFLWLLYIFCLWFELDFPDDKIPQSSAGSGEILMGGAIGLYMFSTFWDWVMDCIQEDAWDQLLDRLSGIPGRFRNRLKGEQDGTL